MNEAESSLDWDDLRSMQERCLFDIGCGDPILKKGQDHRTLQFDAVVRLLKKLDPDQCRLESGYRALEELLIYRDLPHNKQIRIDDENREWKEINLASIEEVKKDLLRRAYEALHPASPMRRSFNELNFHMVWEDFDPCIMSQLVNDPEKSRVPDLLVVMGQGVYQEFINQKDFKATNLIVYDEYIGLDPYEPPELVEAYPKTYPKGHPLYPKPHPLYEESKDRLTVLYKDLPTEFKERLINQTSQAIEAETLREQKRQEKWNLFLEQEDWIRRNGNRFKEHKKKWDNDKKKCQRRVETAQLTNFDAAYLIWARHHLQKKWLENGVPIIPTQKLIKEFLLGNEDSRVKYRFHPSNWVGQTPAEKRKKKGTKNRPWGFAKKWVYLPAGIKNKMSDSLRERLDQK